MPFVWGTNDCCLFPADAIKAFTGVDIASDFRGKYTDEASAFELIPWITGHEVDRASAVEDAAVYCAQKAELKEWPGPLFAQRGDLVVIANGETTIAGVVHLNGRHVISVGQSGLLRLPLRSVKRAWRV